MPAMLGWILVALAESQLKILAPLHTWSYSVADNSYIHARATLPSPRLHGAARGLRARSAPRAATGACPTTIRDVLRVQSPPGAPHAARRAHFHPANPPLPSGTTPPRARRRSMQFKKNSPVRFFCNLQIVTAG